jgi:hypothetical protein
VPEQSLDDADVDPIFQEVGGESVAQGVEAHGLGDPCLLLHLAEDRLDRLGRQGPALFLSLEEPLHRPVRSPVLSQPAQEIRGQHDVAVLAALALLDPDDHPLAVDVFGA